MPNVATDPCGVLEIDCGLLSCYPKMQLDLKPPQFDSGTQLQDSLKRRVVGKQDWPPLHSRHDPSQSD